MSASATAECTIRGHERSGGSGEAASTLAGVIDVRLLRTDLPGVRAAIARRGSPELVVQVDEAAALDGRLREVTSSRDDTRRQVNELSKQVGRLRRDGASDEAERLMAESRDLGQTEAALADEAAALEAELRQLLLRIPNLPSEQAPDGLSDADNPIVKGPINLPDAYPEHQRVPHWEAATALGILDNERAAKISGAMFTMPRGLGATLSRALCQLALDRNADAFEEIRPPTLVTTATLTATGQLPKFADDSYLIERDDLWCIPTAEVPLTSLAAGEILDEEDLPVRMMASTACYRREAGSAGRDTRGMLRSHEFDKVEVVAYATPEQAPAMLDELIARAESTIAALGLPYRIIEICTADLGQSHHRSFDIEVYAPGVHAWLEVSSISWFSDYQARRADVRYRPLGEKGTAIVHTLNGSALAVPRVWAAVIENNRQADGSIALPEVLWPYLRGHREVPVPAA
jgi:seryl-tRNA synthetase